MEAKSPLVVALAARLMRQEAAPCHEELVAQEVARICEEFGLSMRRDRYGNCIVTLKTGRSRRPVVLVAHMDHPGFEISGCKARFLGGVGDSYFRKGTPIRMLPGKIAARLGSRLGKQRVFSFEPAPAAKANFAVWELEDFTIRNGRIIGRACDDLVGVASILATIIELKQSRGRCHIIGFISRAEEIGFYGTLAATTTRILPRNALVISLETSREMPPVKMGHGVIVRLGDRSSIFDSDATRYLCEVAGDLKLREPGFAWQRALMSGGTCEGTALQHAGFQTAGVCVALGNYHNCAPNRCIAEEFVAVNDAVGMVKLLVNAVRQMPKFATHIGKLTKRLDSLRRQAQRRLKTSPNRRRGH